MENREGPELQEGKERAGERKISREEVEALIARLPSVVSSRLVVNDWGGLDEVHVLTTRERSPKQVVRDVESCLAAQWGISVDHKKISVAQVSDQASPARSIRLILDRYSISRDLNDNQVQVQVGLGHPPDRVSFTGEARGPVLGSHNNRIVAEATLEALNLALMEGYQLGLESIRIQEAGGHLVATAVVTLTDPGGRQEPLAGAGICDDEPTSGVIRACLSAVNRKLGKLYQSTRGEPWGSGEDA